MNACLGCSSRTSRVVVFPFDKHNSCICTISYFRLLWRDNVLSHALFCVARRGPVGTLPARCEARETLVVRVTAVDFFFPGASEPELFAKPPRRCALFRLGCTSITHEAKAHERAPPHGITHAHSSRSTSTSISMHTHHVTLARAHASSAHARQSRHARARTKRDPINLAMNQNNATGSGVSFCP